jgi:hypothetical protein
MEREKMMDYLLYAFIYFIFIYFIAAGITAGLCLKLGDVDKSNSDAIGGALLLGIVWPISLPLAIGILLVYSIWWNKK